METIGIAIFSLVIGSIVAVPLGVLGFKAMRSVQGVSQYIKSKSSVFEYIDIRTLNLPPHYPR